MSEAQQDSVAVLREMEAVSCYGGLTMARLNDWLTRLRRALQSQQVASAEPSQIGYDDGSGRIRDWSGAAPRSWVSDAEFWAERLEMLGDLHGCGGGTMKVCAKLLRELAAQPQPGRVEGMVPGEYDWEDDPAPASVKAQWQARWHEGVADLLLVSHPEHGGIGICETPREARKLPETMLFLLARDLLTPTVSGQEADHG